MGSSGPAFGQTGFGANLSAPCVPKKGVHNGCWMTSPQDVERTSVERFKPYVTDIVSTFGHDPRVLWFETYNEPTRNPHGKGEITDGKWGDDGPWWKEYPQVEAELKPVKADDGIFWVSKEEFFKHFVTIYLCAKDMSQFGSD